ncbi:MAG: hypothetical protein VYC34_08415 [Planctomycetota bacterium]|nr:hypothetical protein [Planctomycetota bacterium]
MKIVDAFKGVVAPAVLALAPAVVAPVASAQPLAVRVEIAAAPFTPLQSHATAHTDTGNLFFGGLSGMGLHILFNNPNQEVAFPGPAYNRNIYLYDDSTETLFTGTTDHLSDTVKEALLVANIPHVQYDDTLFLYGGYGITLDGTDWTTRDTITSIDLTMVEAALRAGTPIPEAAFSVTQSSFAQTTGALIIKMGDRFALIGGHIFTGDYAQVGTPTFDQVYIGEAYIFDRNVSMTTPVQTLISPLASELHRRDMNASPAVLPAQGGGVDFGFVINGGVFNGFIPWWSPVTYCDGDVDPVEELYAEQWMNQYEGPRASFYSEANNENRFVLFGGISSHTWNGSNFTFDFNTPWTAEITENRMVNGIWQGVQRMNDFTGQMVTVTDNILGQMPLPVSNTDLVINPLLPTNVNGQVLLDETPANEFLLGRFYGGLNAAMPGNEVPTYASSTITEIYVVYGVRGDITRDGVVNAADLSELLGSWGTSSTVPDLNLDGIVNAADLATLLGNWGNDTPG